MDILIVEDDFDLSAIYRAALAAGRHSIRICGDGAEALAAVAAQLPDLALLDVNTPGPDGYEVCRAIRALESEAQAVTVIMVTARNDITSKLLAFAAGADDYLVKPLEVAELRSRVSRWLGTRSVQREVVRRRRQEAIQEVIATVCDRTSGPLSDATAAVTGLLRRPDLDAPVSQELQEVQRQLEHLKSVLTSLQSSTLD